MCLYLLKQTIIQYEHSGSPIFVAFDASKAFEKVNRSVLFKKLLESKVPVIFIHLLARLDGTPANDLALNGIGLP